MPSLSKQDGRFYLQFYGAACSPKRKRIALGTSRRRAAEAKDRRLEVDYASGKFDPWTDDPDAYGEPRLSPKKLLAALQLFLEAKRRQGRAQETLREKEKLSVRTSPGGSRSGPRPARSCNARRFKHRNFPFVYVFHAV